MVMNAEVDLRQALRGELRSREKLLWVGQPEPIRAAMQYGDLVWNAVGAVAISLILVFVWGAIGFNVTFSGTSLSTLIVLFIFIAALASLARPAWEYFAAAQTVYAITEHRVIIIKPVLLGGAGVQSYGDRQIQVIERREIADGKGDIIFAKECIQMRGRRRRSRLRIRNIGFFGIAEARRVEDIMLSNFRGWAEHQDLNTLS
jgi:hypothetical protein